MVLGIVSFKKLSSGVLFLKLKNTLNFVSANIGSYCLCRYRDGLAHSFKLIFPLRDYFKISSHPILDNSVRFEVLLWFLCITEKITVAYG